MLKILFCIVWSNLICLCLKADLPTLIPIRIGDRFGYCDQARQVVLPAQFEDAQPFGIHGAIVQVAGKRGMIDQKGNWIIAPTLDEILIGQGVILRSGKRFAIADLSGKHVPKFDFDAIYEMKNGCFLTEQPNGKGMIAPAGHTIVPNLYEHVTQLHDNQGNWIDLIKVRDQGLLGLYNICSERVQAPRFSRIDAFQEGFAVVQEGDQFGLIDLEGQLRVPCNYDMLQPMNGGLCAAKLKNRWGFIDAQGREVLPFLYEAVQENGFFQGRAAVNKAGTWVFVQRNGEVEFPLDLGYQSLGSISEGLIAVCRLMEQGEVKYGYLTAEGKLMIPFAYDRAEMFKRGFAIVGQQVAKDQSIVREMRYGVIDRQGRTVIPAILHAQTQARLKRDSLGYLGFTTLIVNGKSCKIDARGRRFDCAEDAIDGIQKMWTSTRCENTSLVAVVKDGRWGFCDRNGKLRIPCQYANVQCFADGLARVWPIGGDGKLSYYIDESGQAYYEPS